MKLAIGMQVSTFNTEMALVSFLNIVKTSMSILKNITFHHRVSLNWAWIDWYWLGNLFDHFLVDLDNSAPMYRVSQISVTLVKVTLAPSQIGKNFKGMAVDKLYLSLSFLSQFLKFLWPMAWKFLIAPYFLTRITLFIDTLYVLAIARKMKKFSALICMQ